MIHRYFSLLFCFVSAGVLLAGCTSSATENEPAPVVIAQKITYVDIPFFRAPTSNEGYKVLSPDGTKVALCSGYNPSVTSVFDTRTGQKLSTLTNSYFTYMQFSCDNTKLLTFYSCISIGTNEESRFTQVYDITDSLFRLRSTVMGFTNARLLDDGSAMVGCQPKGTFELYTSQGGRIIKQLSNKKMAIYSFGYIPDDYAVIFRDEDTARVWDVIQDKEVRHFIFEGGTNGFSSFFTSEDGKVLSTGKFFYDTKTGQKISNEAPRGYHTSQYQYMVENGTTSDKIRCLELTNQKEVYSFDCEGRTIGKLVLSRNGQCICTAMISNTSPYQKLRIWNIQPSTVN